jgi:hypothetical protein
MRYIYAIKDDMTHSVSGARLGSSALVPALMQLLHALMQLLHALLQLLHFLRAQLGSSAFVAGSVAAARAYAA